MKSGISMMFDDASLKKLAEYSEVLPELIERLNLESIESFEEAIQYLEAEMERKSDWARDLLLGQPPKQFLGHIWSFRYLKIGGDMVEQGKDYRPDKNYDDAMQYILEFAHATWSSVGIQDGKSSLDEGAVGQLFNILDELRNLAMLYCVSKATVTRIEENDARRGAVVMRAFTSWVHERGRRYQVLEEEFLRFVLEPHTNELERCYDMSAEAIASGLQELVHTMRSGISQAVETIGLGMDEASGGAAPLNFNSAYLTEMSSAFDDLLNGGICNMSRHTKLTSRILQDLSFSPGEEQQFLDDGPLRGTPLRTLPTRVKPAIKLGEDYYVTDGNFVRDVAYRTIQRGLLRRNPVYREVWNDRQARMSEHALLRIFQTQLAEATIFRQVFYPHGDSGNWVETDLIVIVDDVLVVVEAKAGCMAMESPAIDFEKHMNSVERLLVRAYRQCKRFLEYLNSSGNSPIYALQNGQYIEVAQLCLGDFRKVFPIGLTIEALSPFSTCVHSLEGIEPLLDKHGFMSISIDDLMVLNRFLPTVGELMHYLEARQTAGAIPNTVLFDEMEYLGAYISLDRFDEELRKQYENSNIVMWNTFADIVDKYFQGESAGTGPVPSQIYPKELATILLTLDEKQPPHWLSINALIRNLRQDERDRLAEGIEALRDSLARHENRWIGWANDNLLWVCVSRIGSEPSSAEIIHRAEVACIAMQKSSVCILILSYSEQSRLTKVACQQCVAPNQNRSDFVKLAQEAVAVRNRSVEGRDFARIQWD